MHISLHTNIADCRFHFERHCVYVSSREVKSIFSQSFKQVIDIFGEYAFLLPAAIYLPSVSVKKLIIMLK